MDRVATGLRACGIGFGSVGLGSVGREVSGVLVAPRFDRCAARAQPSRSNPADSHRYMSKHTQCALLTSAGVPGIAHRVFAEAVVRAAARPKEACRYAISQTQPEAYRIHGLGHFK